MLIAKNRFLSHFVSAVVLWSTMVITTPLLGQRSSGDENVIYDPSLFNALEYRMIGPYRGGRSTPHLLSRNDGWWSVEDDG